MSNYIEINGREIGEHTPTYFIADIAANHDGSLQRAKELIELAKISGADAVKFQHFQAETIVSDKGFKDLGASLAHQKQWDNSVFEVYKKAEFPWEWTLPLKEFSDSIGIDFFTAPYSLELIEKVHHLIPAFKVGSGDVNWHESIRKMCSYGKPVIVATGASTFREVAETVEVLESEQVKYSLMQCNTNYTGILDNVSHSNLNVLKNYAKHFPNAILGLSDHTPGHVTVLGAISLGARLIEKHFTDDVNRTGPDHKFSMDQKTWSAMVRDSRLLESALGDGDKKIEANEIESGVVQRRSIRYSRALKSGSILSREDLVVLRPAPKGSIGPDRINEFVGKELLRDVTEHETALLNHI
jgi:sialic acid synthase SpsE